MTLSIADINKFLISGDKVWIARQMPGNFKSNQVQISKLLNGKLKGRGKINGLILDLAIRRVKINQQVAKEIQGEVLQK